MSIDECGPLSQCARSGHVDALDHGPGEESVKAARAVPLPLTGTAMDETPEQKAMRAATIAVRKILATAKNPRTILGQMSPTSVAFHAAWAAIQAHREALQSTANLPNRPTEDR
jgi:hypothetical protein